MSIKYMYTREYHMQYLLNKQNKSNIPNEIIEMIKQNLNEHNLEPNAINIKKILRDNRLQRYYLDVPYCVKILFETQMTSVQLLEEIECPICYEHIVTCTKLKCDHMLCNECIKIISKDNVSIKCPICRDICTIKEYPSLTLEEQKLICQHYTVNKKKYEMDGHDMLFDTVIRMIMDELGINKLKFI